MPKSILELSKRTVTKIMKRLNLGCSNCGWSLTTCDIHHIVHQSKGGSDEHTNLTNLCPNCHRCAHAGLLTKFVTLEEQIGDRWKDAYFPELSKKKANRNITSNHNIIKYTKDKRKAADDRAVEIITMLKESDIDFSKFGWVKKASAIIDIAPNKVNWWFKRYDPEFLETCFTKQKFNASLAQSGRRVTLKR